MENLSQETQQMFDIVDRYETGELNLEQATKMIIACTPQMEAEKIKNILKGVERENLLNFPKP